MMRVNIHNGHERTAMMSGGSGSANRNDPSTNPAVINVASRKMIETRMQILIFG